MFKSLNLHSRILYLCLPVTLFVASFMSGCQKERERKDSPYQTISSFISTFDYYLADSIALTQVDSIGELVMSLPNSQVNREIINEFIDKTKSSKRYSDHLYEYGLEDNDSSSVANALYLTSAYYSLRTMMDSSYYYLSQSEGLFLQLNDSLMLSKVFLYKSTLLAKNGIYSLAEKQIGESLAYSTKKLPLYIRVDQLIILGKIYSGMGMSDDALHFYSMASEMLRSKDATNEIPKYDINLYKVYLFDNISKVYIKQGKYKEARELLVETIEKYIDFSNVISERYYGYTSIDLAKVKMLQKDYEGVLSLLERALSIGIKNKNRIIINNSKLALAEYFYAVQQETKGKEILSEVLDRVRIIGDLESQLKALEILIAYEPTHVEQYFTEYKEITRQNKDEANNLRNYFIRIKDEADSLNTMNKVLSAKNRLLMIMGGSLVLVLVIILLMYIYRAKLKKVGLIKMFQRDTEQYYNSIINIQNSLALVKDRERSVIASELNDGVLNRLFAARFSLLQLQREHIGNQKDLLVNEIVEVEKYIREVSHTIVNESSVQIQEFEQLLRELVLMQKKQSMINYSIQFDPQLDLEKLIHRKKINIYRSIQEVLTNVQLHSSAHHCRISFIYKNNASFEVNIADDGVGFDTRSIKKGNGLLHIKERIETIGGKLLINSKLNTGTTYVFIIKN